MAFRRNELSERELGETGLNEALERLRERLHDSGGANALVSLAETLEWLYGLESYQAKRLGWTQFDGLRIGSVDGETEAGLTYARGLFTHSLVATAHLVLSRGGSIRMNPGRRVPMGRGVSLEYTWKRLSDLPLPNRAEPHGRDQLYQQHVEGRLVLPPVEAAVRFITGIQ